MFSALLELLLRPFTYTHTIIKDIGCGSFGTILLTQSKLDKKYFVAKFIKKKKIKDYVGYNAETMIPLEIYLQAQLCHPAIARVTNCYRLAQHWVFTMPYCDNYMDLKSFIKIHVRLDEAVARTILAQVYTAISYCLGRGIDHRDIKHQNILINRTSLHIKLIDFGLASICVPGRTVYTKVQGTELFLAPEAIVQKRYTPLENTTWALGCLLYCMVCGTVPFTCSRDVVFSPPPFPTFLSPALVSFLQLLLSKTRQDRIHFHAIPQHVWLMKEATLLAAHDPYADLFPATSTVASSEVSSGYSDCCSCASQPTASSGGTFNKHVSMFNNNCGKVRNNNNITTNVRTNNNHNNFTNVRDCPNSSHTNISFSKVKSSSKTAPQGRETESYQHDKNDISINNDSRNTGSSFNIVIH